MSNHQIINHSLTLSLKDTVLPRFQYAVWNKLNSLIINVLVSLQVELRQTLKSRITLK